MDLDMFAHPTTTRNIDLLRSYGNHIIEPTSGELASHLVGKGRMAEPESIVEHLNQFFAATQDLAGKNVLITAGPTYEKIDPVRFIGNYSSGKMGYAIAEEAARRGANVTIVSGPVSIKAQHPSIKVIGIESARQMHQHCTQLFPAMDIAIMCAAVADYAPAQQFDAKIKREKDEIPTITLVKNPDIAADLGKMKTPCQKLIGFALETNDEEANAQAKLAKKNLDAIVLNSLRDKDACFGTDTNKITIFFANGNNKQYPLKSKAEVAKDIIDSII
jgi:phosphopantothenoylcysteine decarboxylase/phosphopantothenate--cysteine ligase